MILYLMQLVKDKSRLECETDEEWTKMIDRDGLWHVKETTFQLFCAIENQVRAILNDKNPSPPSKAEIIQHVTSDDLVVNCLH